MRPADINPDRRCGWPVDCKLPDAAHPDLTGTWQPWGWHEVQCPRLNPRPGPHLDGYPECSMIDGHEGDCDYIRHAAEVTV